MGNCTRGRVRGGAAHRCLLLYGCSSDHQLQFGWWCERMVDSGRAGSAPRSECRGSRHRGLASRAHADAPRRSPLHDRPGLGLRDLVSLHPAIRHPSQIASLRRPRRALCVGCGSRRANAPGLRSQRWALVVGGRSRGRGKGFAVSFDAVEIDLASIWGPDPLPVPESS